MTVDWVNYFAEIARAAARKAHCPNRKVGAVIVKDKQIISTGFNGVPSGFPHCSICYDGERSSGSGLDNLPCLHAEENAIIQAAKRVSESLVGATMICTNFPCNSCLRMIIQSGIERVYYLEDYHLDEEGEQLRQYLVVTANQVNGFFIARVIE